MALDKDPVQPTLFESPGEEPEPTQGIPPLDGSHESIELAPHGGDSVDEVPGFIRKVGDDGTVTDVPLTHQVVEQLIQQGRHEDPSNVYQPVAPLDATPTSATIEKPQPRLHFSDSEAVDEPEQTRSIFGWVRKHPKASGITAAALAAGGIVGAVLAPKGGSSSEASVKPSTVATSTQHPGTTSPSTSESPSVSVTETAPATPNQLVDVDGNPLPYQPKLMTANDPQELLNQWGNNELAMYQVGASPLGQSGFDPNLQNTISKAQEQIARYTYGTTLEAQPWLSTTITAIEQSNNVYLNADPNLIRNIKFSLLGSKQEGDKMTLQVKQVETDQGITTDGKTHTYVIKLVFGRSTPRESGIDNAPNPDEPIWVVTLEDGNEVSAGS